MKPLLKIDWDVIAGIAAALIALVLHFFHIVQVDALMSILVVLVALLLIRDLRRENREEKWQETRTSADKLLQTINTNLSPPDVLLVGPQKLRPETHRFCAGAEGEMIWFNVCLLMFRPQSLFDTLLKPAIENPKVSSIQFILNHSEQKRWEEEVLPKIRKCSASHKVMTPHWCELKESVSFILSGIDGPTNVQALLSFWGEPFMSYSTEQEIPRYVFQVQPHSELIARLTEMVRGYRLKKFYPVKKCS